MMEQWVTAVGRPAVGRLRPPPPAAPRCRGPSLPSCPMPTLDRCRDGGDSVPGLGWWPGPVSLPRPALPRGLSGRGGTSRSPGGDKSAPSPSPAAAGTLRTAEEDEGGGAQPGPALRRPALHPGGCPGLRSKRRLLHRGGNLRASEEGCGPPG
ncbi:uncharacterized protein LOC141737211 isoform X2 [Larus michahellis]|uniref:uncharacterized protein LOC141737211 isoform X2 n=1 Tax=Larus michahellis TaxID=119627 RepID=UPI003D9BA75C